MRTSGVAALVGMMTGVLSPVVAGAQGTGTAQTAAVAADPKPAGVGRPPEALVPSVPADYLVGAEDIFTVKVWEDDRIQGKVIVGPDGTVSLPLINSVKAVGLTFEGFRQAIVEAAQKYVVGTVTVTLTLEQINSRKVYVGGEVRKPGVYPLIVPLRLSQMVIVAGGLTEYANKKKIVVQRDENGKRKSYTINYDDILNGKNLDKDIELKPGDTVNIPD